MKNLRKFFFLGSLIFLVPSIPGNTCFAQKKDILESIAKSKGDSSERISSFYAYPYAYYTPETNLAFTTDHE